LTNRICLLLQMTNTICLLLQIFTLHVYTCTYSYSIYKNTRFFRPRILTCICKFHRSSIRTSWKSSRSYSTVFPISMTIFIPLVIISCLCARTPLYRYDSKAVNHETINGFSPSETHPSMIIYDLTTAIYVSALFLDSYLRRACPWHCYALSANAEIANVTLRGMISICLQNKLILTANSLAKFVARCFILSFLFFKILRRDATFYSSTNSNLCNLQSSRLKIARARKLFR